MNIGIFWIHKETVLGTAEDGSHGFKGYGGLVDSNFDHVHVWGNLALKKQFPELKNMDYEQVTRGRVLFSTTQNKHIVYMDKALFTPLIKQKIADFFGFNISQVLWKKDPHYNTGQDELSHLFDD